MNFEEIEFNLQQIHMTARGTGHPQEPENREDGEGDGRH